MIETFNIPKNKRKKVKNRRPETSMSQNAKLKQCACGLWHGGLYQDKCAVCKVLERAGQGLLEARGIAC